MRKIRPETRLTPMAIAAIRRRPTRSERWPAKNRLAMTPTAYAAKITVTVREPKWSRAPYST
jgi:hypothetical protein